MRQLKKAFHAKAASNQNRMQNLELGIRFRSFDVCMISIVIFVYLKSDQANFTGTENVATEQQIDEDAVKESNNDEIAAAVAVAATRIMK